MTMHLHVVHVASGCFGAPLEQSGLTPETLSIWPFRKKFADSQTMTEPLLQQRRACVSNQFRDPP